MSKNSRWVCNGCGAGYGGAMGRCTSCGEFGTVHEEVAPDTGSKGLRTRMGGGYSGTSGSVRTFQPLREVEPDRHQRMSTGIGELDRVLGGGVVPGSVVLVGGEPGIGKSTLLGMLARNLALKGEKVAYISGEESLGQIKMRADRLGDSAPSLLALAETDLESIIASVADIHPALFILDSIQTITTESLTGAAGSVGQVRQSAQEIARFAKSQRISAFIVSHVTKEGTIAGPKVLEHIVDTVLYLEGDRFHTYRMLRAYKNRFGSVDEVGIFQMESEGMTEVTNPSEIFLSEQSLGASGSVVAATIEGSRPLLVEVQALTADPLASFPKRTVSGLDLNRTNVICAVLAKKTGLGVYNRDVYVNLAGGLRTTDPACDLAIACAIASAYRNIPIGEKTVIIGEVGLTGEIRKVAKLEQRIREAARLGFAHIITPKGKVGKYEGVTISQFGTLAECIIALGLASKRAPADLDSAPGVAVPTKPGRIRSTKRPADADAQQERDSDIPE